MEAPASPLQQLSLERGDEGRGVRCPPPPHAALHNPAVMAATFACLDDEASLLRCSAVCRAWWGVLNADDVWQAAYARALPAPAPHERAIRCDLKLLVGCCRHVVVHLSWRPVCACMHACMRAPMQTTQGQRAVHTHIALPQLARAVCAPAWRSCAVDTIATANKGPGAVL